MNNTIQHKSVGLLLVLLFGFFAINTASAQAPTEGVSYENVESYIYEGSIHLSFDLKLEGDFLSSGDALHIHPVYRTGSGELALPSVLVNGKQRASFYRREQAHLSESERMINKPFAVIVRNNKETQYVTYNYVVPIPEGVSTKGTLHINQQLQDCCDLTLVDTQLLPLEYRQVTLDPAMFANTVTYITPEEEKVKKRSDNLVIRIEYPVNIHEVLPSFGNNKWEIEKMDKELKPLFSDEETYQIANAVIKGYASPEGTFEHNLILSHRRTETFKQFLMNKYGVSEMRSFNTEGMGEDWQGLRKAVEVSNMEHKTAVLGVIDSEGVFDGREKMLMELAGGNLYNYMLQEIFPRLRRMEMEINYTVRAFDWNEVETVMQERPKVLSQLEMFHHIQKRNNNDLYFVAAEYFPNSVSANVNASSVALSKGDVELAWTYLSKVEDNPDAYNNLGIYYWLKGNIDKAESYFRKALNVGGQQEKAAANIKMLEKYLIR